MCGRGCARTARALLGSSLTIWLGTALLAPVLTRRSHRAAKRLLQAVALDNFLPHTGACPCLNRNINNVADFGVSGDLVVSIGGKQYIYVATCQTHDVRREPFWDAVAAAKAPSNEAPSWCSNSWCYVNPFRDQLMSHLVLLG